MSNTVDWSKAPEGAEFFSYGEFYKSIEGKLHYCSGVEWKLSLFDLQNMTSKHDYQPRPAPQEKPMKYEYGVEYPTNGVKPDLPDDVLVEVTYSQSGAWFENTADDIRWLVGGVVSFRIVDERYKPAAAPAEQTNKYDRKITGKYSTGKCTIDVYRVLAAYDVTDSEVAHAVKKLLAPGQRGVKEERQDIEEAIQSLQALVARMDDEGVK